MSPKTRERYAVLMIPEGVLAGSFDPGPPLELGVPSKWAPCGISRALALRYTAGESEKLPQAKAVKSVLAAWAKGRGLKKIRVAVLNSLDETGIESLLKAWDARLGLIGSNVTLSYPVVLVKTARDSSTNVSVDLNQRLGWLAGKALPWINQRLRELHREDTLEAAPGWLRRGTHGVGRGNMAIWEPCPSGRRHEWAGVF